MKGIVLAGGAGTRLHPVTKSVNKHLLPVYNKPMIYYPISTLKRAGITDVMIITTPDDMDAFYKLLGTGEEFGMNFFYETQDTPKGIADAFNIADEWIGDEAVTLILGDNIFYSSFLDNEFSEIIMETEVGGVANIFAYKVADPERYGVIRYDDAHRPLDIIEKPTQYVSDWAVVGLYCYPKGVARVVEPLTPSPRGELEITDLNNLYFDAGLMMVNYMRSETTWLDTGTHDSLIEASMFVKTIQDRTNIKIGDINV